MFSARLPSLGLRKNEVNLMKYRGEPLFSTDIQKDHCVGSSCRAKMVATLDKEWMEIQPEVLLDFNTFHLSLFSLNL
jgi:hypothetical protein